MDNFFVRSWWVLALCGAVGILFGVLTLAWPGLTLLTLIALFAPYALLAGLASIAFGAIVFLYPFAGVLTLIWMVTLYPFVTGALLLLQAAR